MWKVVFLGVCIYGIILFCIFKEVYEMVVLWLKERFLKRFRRIRVYRGYVLEVIRRFIKIFCNKGRS